MNHFYRDLSKTLKVIKSCENRNHLDVATNIIDLFEYKYEKHKEIPNYIDILRSEKLYKLKYIAERPSYGSKKALRNND